MTLCHILPEEGLVNMDNNQLRAIIKVDSCKTRNWRIYAIQQFFDISIKLKKNFFFQFAIIKELFYLLYKV